MAATEKRKKPEKASKGQALPVAPEDFEDLSKGKQQDDFAVRQILGVWQADNYLCPRCGQVFDYGKITGPELVCTNCGYSKSFDKKVPLRSSVMVYERVSPPWWSLTSAEVEAQWQAEMEDEVTEHPEINQECPNCGHDKLQFWTRQLRSADEGLSVFFLCKKCGWRNVEK
eukprot:s2282_g4.t1